MAASAVNELYVSPNGDRWLLARNASGELVVRHYPNRASGGTPSEFAVDVFLSRGGQGPEHQALAEALATLEPPAKISDDSKLDAKAIENVDRALLDKRSRAAGANSRQRFSTLCLRLPSKGQAKRLGKTLRCICTTSMSARSNQCRRGRCLNRIARAGRLTITPVGPAPPDRDNNLLVQPFFGHERYRPNVIDENDTGRSA
jgi:hypothetical protein